MNGFEQFLCFLAKILLPPPPEGGLLCRRSLISMFVRCLSVRRPSSVRVTFFPHKQCRFHGSPLFGSVFRSLKSLKHFAKCVGFWLLLGENNPKTNQNPTHFAKCSSDFRDLKSGYFLDHLSKSKDLSDVGHVTQSLMVWIMLSTNLLRIWGGPPLPCGCNLVYGTIDHPGLEHCLYPLSQVRVHLFSRRRSLQVQLVAILKYSFWQQTLHNDKFSGLRQNGFPDFVKTMKEQDNTFYKTADTCVEGCTRGVEIVGYNRVALFHVASPNQDNNNSKSLTSFQPNPSELRGINDSIVPSKILKFHVHNKTYFIDISARRSAFFSKLILFWSDSGTFTQKKQ